MAGQEELEGNVDIHDGNAAAGGGSGTILSGPVLEALQKEIR